MALLEERRSTDSGDTSTDWGGRWLVTTRCEGDNLVVEAQRIGSSMPRNQRLRTVLSVADWSSMGFGPLQFMGLEQKQHLSRRLMYPGVMCLVRRRQAQESSDGGGSLSLVVRLRQVLEINHTFSLEDVGESVALIAKRQSDGGSDVRVLLSARDLHDFVPSLQLSPFAPEASKLFGFSPSHTPPPAETLSAGLAPFRFPRLARRFRPGRTKEEVRVDDVDAELAWEEVRRCAALRDLEPEQRRALLHRLRFSLDLATTNEPVDEPPSTSSNSSTDVIAHSCPQPMPSSLVQLEVAVNEDEKEAEAAGTSVVQVSVSPPAPMCPGAGAVTSFSLQFIAPNRTLSRSATKEEEGDTGSCSTYELNLLVATRGRERYRMLLDHRELTAENEEEDLTRLWQEVDEKEESEVRSRLISSLVRFLQRKAGQSATAAKALVASCESKLRRVLLRPLPTAPVPILLQQIPVSFSRTEPLTLSAFDTGRGVLLVAEMQGTSYTEQSESELSELERVRASKVEEAAAAAGGGCDDLATTDLLEERQGRLMAAVSASSALTGEGRLSLRRLGGDTSKEDSLSPLATRARGRGVCVASAEIPSAVFGASREPLLMTPNELNRLLLGSTEGSHRRWREQRRGRARDDFLSLDLADALAYVATTPEEEEDAEGKPSKCSGIFHWVAPFTGDTKVGTIVRRHADGCVDVRVAADRSLLRRVDPAELRVPIRSDNKRLLRLSKLDQATSRDHHPLRSKAAYAKALVNHEGEVDGFDAAADESKLGVGCAVQVFTRRAPTHLTPSTQTLQYTRGEETYAAAVSGDAFALGGHGKSVQMSALPVHLQLLLRKEPESKDEEAGSYPESMPFDSSSVASWIPFMCAGHSTLASMATVTTRLSKSSKQHVVVEEEAPEVAAERARREKLAEIFYKKMSDKLIRAGDVAMRSAEVLGNSNNVPIEYPPDEEDLEEDEVEEPEVVAARAESLLLDAGETEAAARKRVLRQRRLYVEASETFKQALRRSPNPDPRLFGRLSTVMLRLHQYDEALAYTEKAEVHFKDSPGLVFNRGQALMGLNRFNDAFTAFDECLHMGDGKVLDVELVRKYRAASIVKRRKFKSAEDTLVLEIESSNERQRDIDQKLNVFNLYDSVIPLTRKHELPNIQHPSKLVNPISQRLLKVGYPTASTKKRMRRAIRSRNRSRERAERAPRHLPAITDKATNDGALDLSSQEAPPPGTENEGVVVPAVATEGMLWGDEDDDSSSDEEGGGKAGYVWEEDEDGEADENVLFEFELETSLGVIEVTVRKGEDVRTLVDDLRSSNPGALTRRQADKLVDTLAGRQLQEEQNGASYEERHTQKVPAL
jgi:tetratricopeptide (TPR) repeat protein